MHRAGQGGELRLPRGKDPEEEDAEHAQKCHPGDQADLRVWWWSGVLWGQGLSLPRAGPLLASSLLPH